MMRSKPSSPPRWRNCTPKRAGAVMTPGSTARAISPAPYGLADEAGDAYGIANAAWHAGLTLVRSGHPNDALKLFQLGQLQLGRVRARQVHTSDPARRRPPGTDPNHAAEPAVRHRLRPHEPPRPGSPLPHRVARRVDPQDAFERGDADLETAVIQLDQHRLDTAEQLATGALRSYGVNHRLGRTMTELLLAEVHIRAGEPRELTLAHQAIEGVITLQSATARQQRLVPLATALKSRPGSDTWKLAQRARKVAATRT
jgi:hypothetical protein